MASLRQFGRGQALLRQTRLSQQCRAPITAAAQSSRTLHNNRVAQFSLYAKLHTSRNLPRGLSNQTRAASTSPPPSSPPPAPVAPVEPAATAAPVVAAVKQKPRLVRWLWRGFTFLGIFVGTGGLLVLAFFLFDATTYREDAEVIDLNVSEYALNPRRGGPKNLPIVEHLVDDDDSPQKKLQKHKPKLVILGTGWGSVALLKQLNPDDYHVTVVSPSNYFLFTPMLPSATVGTLEIRSLVEPVRRIVARVYGHFLRGQAQDVDFSAKLVEIAAVGSNGEQQNFYLPYDKLVIGVGSITNPHGVKGLENCHFLKDITDARLIRNQIVRNLETASLPTTSDEERRRLLSFVVSGGGPTGVEFAAELYDMLNEDLGKYYPRILRNEISVHVIQSRGHILNTYDEALSKFAEVGSAPSSTIWRS